MAELSVRILQTGTVGVDKAVPNRSVSPNPLAYTGLFRSRKNHIVIPVKCFLIIHPDGHKILIDTGWDSKVRKEPIKTLTFPMWFASKPSLPPKQAVDEQLSLLGIKPEDLDYVILTHLDIDHDSGLRMVKNAPHIMASAPEIKALHSSQVRYVLKPCRGINIEPITWNGSFGPYGKSWDVFNDGRVVVFFTPGHSQGSISIKVQNGSHYLLIVGDSGYNKESWDSLNIPGPVYDKEEMKKTLLWIQAKRSDPFCKAVLCAHDPSSETKPQEIIL